MPLWKNTQHAFVAGQLDTHVMGRQDMEKYGRGATLLKNFLVKRQGCISKRRGTDLTADLDGILGTANDGTPITPGKMRLVPVTNGDDGRYVILSGGVGFVANRDGILTCDRNRVRSVKPYVAQDIDGKPIIVTGKDVRQSTAKPVDRIRRYSTGKYKVWRHSSLQAAFNNAADGDTIRLHSNLMLTEAATLSTTGTVTLDLYGYKLTTTGTYGIGIPSASTTLTVKSSRVGASVCVCGAGSGYAAFMLDSGTNGTPSGSLVLDGDIKYNLYTSGSYGCIVSAKDAIGVTINRGTFTSYGTALATSIVHVKGGPLEINGGTFLNKVTDGTTYRYLIFANHDNTVQQDTDVTINGGSFTNEDPLVGSTSYRDYWSYVVMNAQSSKVHLTLNGGRFKAASAKNFFRTAAANSGTDWRWGYLRIVRGEFSSGTIYSLFVNDTLPIGDFMDDGSVHNVAQPNDDGFFGIKVDGEGDYQWDGTVGSASMPYRFAVPYADDDLADLCIRQSGDTLFIAHRDYPPAKIWFDAYGNAYFEELTFDNTDYQPPVVESAEMVGNDPKETDNWPAEFPRPKTSSDAAGDCVTVDNAYWYAAKCPSWLTSAQKQELVRFKLACLALGTVTDAGFNGNSTSGDDGSYSRACSYTCTSVSINRATGKKTTTISVKSFTASATVEEKVNYVNGEVSGSYNPDTGQITLPSQTRTTTAGGSAENSASVTSVIVTRTVRYVATYVKDGKESRPSSPVAIDYDMPWANNAVVNLTLGKGANDGEPEYYNVYKDNGNGYGLIATVGADRIAGGIEGGVDTYPLFMPDNTGGSSAIVCAADYEERKGWATGDIMRKMVSSGKDRFTTSPANDICLINTATNASDGIELEFPTAVRFDRIGVMLDGRIYDKERDASYVIVSTSRVTCTVTYELASGTTGTASLTQTSPQFYSYGGIAGVSYYGIYEDWVGLQRRSFEAPNHDTVYGWLYGEGDCTDEFNAHLRRLNFDFASTFAALDGFKGVKSLKFTFSESQYSNWTNNQQGCIHAIHFYSGAATGGTGVVQDDYINPDMTVTPPDNTQDAHFSAADEYPGCVGIYEQRLVFASTRSGPSTIWMSRIADLYNFTVHESIREDDAMELTLAATEFPNINHLVMGRDLMLFGDGGEWLISPVSGNALTYKTASAKLQSMIGSERTLNPLQLADETLFAERGGTCLRSINYNYTSDSYQSEDLSVIAQSIFRANPIVSMAYKQHPDSIVECVLKDGRVATLVYMKEQEVAAWSVQELGGGWKAREIATPKCIVDGTTEMMLLVEKNGVFQLWKVRNDNDEATDAVRVTLDGLHMERSAGSAAEGEVAVTLGDGTYAVGWPVMSEFVSVRPEPEKGPTAQMEVKNATEAEVRVIDASTFSVKPYGASSGWREVSLPVVRDGSSVALAEKDCKKLMTGSNNRDGRLHLKHSEPWPLTILSISTTYQVEYENGGNDGQ